MKTNQHVDPRSRGGAFSVPYKWQVLFIVALSTTMSTMDFSITNLSFPVLVKSFNTDLAGVMWVGLIFSLVSISLMLLLGKVSDVLGRKRIFTVGIAIFSIGLVTCALAQDLGQLIAFRILQAVGAAMVIICGPAIVTDAFPHDELGKGIGLTGASASLGFIIGPILGGLLLKWFNWPSIFLTRFPFGVIIFFMALVLFKRDAAVEKKVRFDIAGTLTSSFGLFLLILGVSQITRLGYKSPIILTLILLGVLGLTIFVLVERKAAEPVVDLSLFHDKIFAISILILFLSFMTYPSYLLIMPFYLMEGLGLTSSEAGVLMAVTAIVSVIVSPISGALSDRFGPRWLLVFGTVSTLISYILMMNFDLQTGSRFIIYVMVLMGVGIGTFHTPNNSTIMGAVPKDRRGTASALLATKRNVGLSLGMALTGTIYSARRLIYESELLKEGADKAYAAVQSIPTSFHDTLLVSILIQSVVVILCLCLKINFLKKSTP